MNITKKFIATAILAPAALLMTGCEKTQNPYEDKAGNKDPNYLLETIRKGDFAETLEDGVHKLTIKADAWSGDHDLNILIIKDATLNNSRATYFGMTVLPNEMGAEVEQTSGSMRPLRPSQ